MDLFPTSPGICMLGPIKYITVIMLGECVKSPGQELGHLAPKCYNIRISAYKP